MACVSDPGTMKTPALGLAAAPVHSQQSQYSQLFQNALAQNDKDQANYLRELDAYKKNKSDFIPEKPERPVLQRSWTADVTTERLAGILKENPRGVLILRDELSAWIKSFNQYKGGKGADKQFFLSAWSGEPLAVDRQGKDPVLVPHPYLSVVGCIPPDVLPDLDEDNREDGFLHRVLFVYPDPVPVRWRESPEHEVSLQEYAALVSQLYSLQPHPDGSPLLLDLTPEAKELFVEWHDKHCEEQEDMALPAIVRGAYAKLKGYTPRFALIHALASNPSARQVDVDSIGAAAELADYFKLQVRRVAPLLGSAAKTPIGRCRHSLLRIFAGGRKVTKRDAQRSVTATTDVFHGVWDELVRQDRLISETDGRRTLFSLRSAMKAQ
jgi:hypothetical protein